MRKKGLYVPWLTIVVFILALMYGYLTTEVPLATIIMAIGIIIIISFLKSEKISWEKAFRSSALMVVAGALIPLLSLDEDISIPLIIVLFAGSVLVIIQRSSKKQPGKAAVHQ